MQVSKITEGEESCRACCTVSSKNLQSLSLYTERESVILDGNSGLPQQLSRVPNQRTLRPRRRSDFSMTKLPLLPLLALRTQVSVTMRLLGRA
ncbi:hypothetical protein ACFX13_021066 [Malus domestica]